MKLFTTMAAVVLSGAVVQAGEVKVKGVHLCCGACVRDVKTALKDVEGVSNAAADRKAKTVTFDAADATAAEAGIKALAKEGFYGTAAHGDKVVKFPASGAKDDAEADKVTLKSVHLCCGGCIVAAKKAAEKVAGATAVDVDRKAKTVVLTGNKIKVAAAVKALNDAGFYASVGE